jgi:exodeoxyribonuclease VII small subunit
MTDRPTEKPFEEALAELEQIVHELEDGSIGLEESLVRYEVGVGLLKLCYARLQAAEQRIAKLAGCDEAGNPILESFAHSTALESAAKRKRESQ